MNPQTHRLTRLGLLCALMALATAFNFTAPPTEGAGPAAPQAALGGGFTYQGQLMDDGELVNAVCDLRFKLFDSSAGGTQLGVSQTVPNVPVTDGLFTVTLNAGNEFGASAFTGEARWLEALVGCPAGGGVYYVLSPRQPVTAAPYALGLRPGAVISGTLASVSLTVYNYGSSGAIYGKGQTFGVQGASDATGGDGVTGYANAVTGDGYGVYGISAAPNGAGVRGESPSTGGGAYGVFGEITSVAGTGVGVFGRAPFYGVRGEATSSGIGVIGESDAGIGAYGVGVTGVLGSAPATSGANYGVYGTSSSSNGYGGYFENISTNGAALYAEGSGAGVSRATLRVHNTESSQGIATYITNTSNFATQHIQNDGSGQVLWLVNGGTDADGDGGGDFITARNNPSNDTQFRVTTAGEVRSDVGFNTPAADFAEMLPAVPGLEPGDVLVIGPDGLLTRSTRTYQSSVAGIYSTQPGFVGGQPVEGELDGHVPLAVLGVVPVKVTDENGAISPGDLLTSSSLPGHAMRASPLTLSGVSFYPSGAILGKALEGWQAGIGVIRMLVVLQ